MHGMNQQASFIETPEVVRIGMARFRVIARWIISWPGLAGALLVVTIGAIGPIQAVDRSLNRGWSDWLFPNAGPVLSRIIDPLASQKVALPLLALVAVWLAWRRRTMRPIVCAAIAEVGTVCLCGAMKLFFARPSPKSRDPVFFGGSLLRDGWHGISYPSGHAIEAVALYGAITILIARYGPGSKTMVWLLTASTAFVAVVTVFQSLYMGWHWMSDLLAGLLAGLLVLRVVSMVDCTSSRLWGWLRTEFAKTVRVRRSR